MSGGKVARSTAPSIRPIAAIATLLVLATGSIAQMTDDEPTKSCCGETVATPVVTDPAGADTTWTADESAAGVRPDYAH